ncbi:120aa long hypothetical protein [Pyrococcus horikoshii OT3]|uniref:Uncharacterized protein n=1 Tax=Pyrococcus horikoshii (strain ATCC 700860 / DSM 12428 / JCM 9974 / NBRC 100139 / OT-3) TaxID=70601 RepID=O59246_PYRHO|nr:120aa long hypothetical protein [Pyrococcus horikoshii OT3]
MNDDTVGYEIMGTMVNTDVVELIVFRFNAFNLNDLFCNESTFVSSIPCKFFKCHEIPFHELLELKVSVSDKSPGLFLRIVLIVNSTQEVPYAVLILNDQLIASIFPHLYFCPYFEALKDP